MDRHVARRQRTAACRSGGARRAAGRPSAQRRMDAAVAHGRTRYGRRHRVRDHRVRADPRHHRRRQRAGAQEPARRTRRSARRAGARERHRRPALGTVALSGPRDAVDRPARRLPDLHRHDGVLRGALLVDVSRARAVRAALLAADARVVDDAADRTRGRPDRRTRHALRRAAGRPDRVTRAVH